MSFEDAILKYRNEVQTLGTVSPSTFLTRATDQLSDESLIDPMLHNFLDILADKKTTQNDANLAVSGLAHQVLTDKRVLGRFEPSKKVLEKINLGRFMHLAKVREMSVELLKRNGTELEYHDFTRDERVICVLQRKELSDIIEDFNGFRTVTTEALVELVNLVYATEERINSKMGTTEELPSHQLQLTKTGIIVLEMQQDMTNI